MMSASKTQKNTVFTLFALWLPNNSVLCLLQGEN
jgi:hypothetical protein